MRYLVTGGAGFIGSHLADYLIQQGHSVSAYDNLSTGRLENIEHLRDHDRFELNVGNVLDYHTLEQHVLRCDCIVHLAAAVGVKLIMEEPVETITTNLRGSENVLKLANYHDKKVLIASTSEVYGKSMDNDTSLDVLRENADRTLGPTTKRRWAYAGSKAMDEFLAMAYRDEKGLEVICARFFNTVGPRQTGRYGMVIPNFVQQALNGNPIHVYGDGTQTRCFAHVKDTVRAIVDLMDVPEAEGEIFNVGNNEEISINELAKRIQYLTNSSSDIVHIPYEEVYGPGFEDMQRRTPDIGKIRRVIDYEPTYCIDDILNGVIECYQ